jgi:Xaa-Pro aminopeptidase
MSKAKTKADAAAPAALAGLDLSPAALKDFIAGVAAAPDQPGDGWIELIAPQAGDDVRNALRTLKDAVAAEDPFPPGPAPSERLAALRAELKRRDIAGFVVPRTDEYQGEYVPARADRLRWLTGFSGSAGAAVVCIKAAAIFVDGRYTLQVEQEVDTAAFEVRHLATERPWDWAAEALPKGARLGYDPWLLTAAEVARYRDAVEGAGGELVPLDENPIDAVWQDQPAAPLAPVVPHDLAYAGKPSSEKRTELGEGLAAAGVDAAVLTMPDSIAWLLNIRGGDVPHTPLPLSFSILHKSGDVDLFIDPRKLASGLGRHLGNGVSVQAPDQFAPALDALGKAGAEVQADQTTAASFIFDRLEKAGARVVRKADPCALPKACKNEVETEGTRQAHLRDGVSLTRFLAWFAKAAPAGGLTELAAADRLKALRSEEALFRDLSFRTISGSGPNGAIVHYSVSEASDRQIGTGELYLLDSGAQYPDGTTDVTRTIAVGTPSAEMRDRFTRVLKGHIALAMAVFPEGTTGSQLDILARLPLWQAGLDFDHGTGHGVGSYLGVHEGPQRISKIGNSVALKPGMIISNEPGYYKTDAYGIRIENLVTVVPCDSVEGAERPLLAFETLTLAPIDRALIARDLLTEDEIAWVDTYHRRVRDSLLPKMDAETSRWLQKATRPLAES